MSSWGDEDANVSVESMQTWSYLGVLALIVVASWWLEFAFRIRVLRDPKRLGLTLLIVIPIFLVWDAFAVSQGHWFFDYTQMTGIIGPFSLPLEEYLFFIVVPIAAILSFESVNSLIAFIRKWRKS